MSYQNSPIGPIPFAEWTALHLILFVFGIVSLDLHRVSIRVKHDGNTDPYVGVTRRECGITDAARRFPLQEFVLGTPLALLQLFDLGEGKHAGVGGG